MVLDFAYTGGTAGDMFQVQWYEPNGTLDVTNTYTQGTTGGSSCYSYELAIAGATPASLTGTWTVKLIWNGTQIYSTPFTISTPTSGGGGSVGVSSGTVSFKAPPGQLPAPQTVQITTTSGSVPYTAAVTYPPADRKTGSRYRPPAGPRLRTIPAA